MNSSSKKVLLEVKNLRKYFPGEKGMFSSTKTWIRAVDDVSFSLDNNDTLGLVGESGCGKTTTGKLILRLLEATSGEVWFDNQKVLELKKKEIRPLRQKMQIIFQDPYSSLNPRMKIGDIVGEPLIIHHLTDERGKRKKVAELFEMVGLRTSDADRYPHEFSGGQRQRIGIARALSLNPKFIILDEPVSALDVSIQGQILNLLKELQEKFELTYLFVAHDLAVVEHISDRIVVMYAGRIVEENSKKGLYSNPLHPYTKSLLDSIPDIMPNKQGFKSLPGEIPSPESLPAGCYFHPRCRHRTERCKIEYPVMKNVGDNKVACFLF